MEIGINDLDDFEDIYENPVIQDIKSPDESTSPSFTEEEEIRENDGDEDIISDLLRSKGILDKSTIKFDNGNGIEETSWDSLSKEDKLNILSSNDTSYADTDLDNEEILLINAMRANKMSPREYLSFVQQQGISNYLQNNVQTAPMEYSVDALSDDDLYVADMIAKLGTDLSDEEILQMLDSAKANEAIYKKLVTALRNEYKLLEYNNIVQNQLMQQQQLVEAYNKFAESIEYAIRDFKDVAGYDINMDEDEMEEVYDFITGFDGAGVSTFGKALNDPRLLVKMAWFVLHGEEAMQDIENYWTTEITNVRKHSYNQGIQDAQKGSKLEIRPATGNYKKSNHFDDLDEF